MAPLLYAVGLFSPAFASAAVATEAFTVNLAGETTPFDASVQTKCVGSSHASTGLRADWREQLTKVHHELGAEYVRFHGLFDDDMSVVIKGQGKTGDVADFAQSKNCTFVAGQDYYDAAGPVFDVASQEECCDACYNQPTGLPEPCVAAVYAPWGKCYTKLASNEPHQADNGVVSCVTDRQGPKGYHYSWVNVFSVFDFLRSIDMRPIVELGFMPELLASDPSNTVFHYKGGISPPKSWDEWRDFMAAFVTALTDRYGAEEIRKWHFEVWNEPNCGFYKDGHCCGPTCGDKGAYLELFTNTYEAIKGVDPHMKVGGPATAQLGWVADFVTNASAANCPPDFVTTHLYPTDPFVDNTRDGFGNAISDAADDIAAAAAAAGVSVPPMFLTEFNCGLGIECADAPFAGSFVAHNALRSQEMLEAVPLQSYWTFSDIFEEQAQQSSEFSQAFGMQSINGVPKPIYRVLQLLGRLHGESVAVSPAAANGGNSSIDVIVTKDKDSVEVMVARHPSFGDSTRATNLAQASGQDVEEDSVEVVITFEGIGPPGEFPADQIELRRVDALNSNALKLWSESGSPDYPNATFLAALQTASEVKVSPSGHLAFTMEGDLLTARVFMPAYSVASISFNVHGERPEPPPPLLV